MLNFNDKLNCFGSFNIFFSSPYVNNRLTPFAKPCIRFRFFFCPDCTQVAIACHKPSATKKSSLFQSLNGLFRLRIDMFSLIHCRCNNPINSMSYCWSLWQYRNKLIKINSGEKKKEDKKKKKNVSGSSLHVPLFTTFRISSLETTNLYWKRHKFDLNLSILYTLYDIGSYKPIHAFDIKNKHFQFLQTVLQQNLSLKGKNHIYF